MSMPAEEADAAAAVEAEAEADEVLAKSGAELFRELFRLYPVAEVEDYFKAGQWDDDTMKTDILILRVHRKEAGAPEPMELEEVPTPELPKTPAPLAGVRPTALPSLGVARSLSAPLIPLGAAPRPLSGPAMTQVRPLAGVRPLTPGLSLPSVRPLTPRIPSTARLAAPVAPTNPAAELRLIALFVAKWKLDPTRTKMWLAKLTPANRKYVIQHFQTQAVGQPATLALEQFIQQCVRTGWAGAASGARMTASPASAVARPTAGLIRPLGAAPRANGVPTAAAPGLKRPFASVHSVPVFDPNKRPRLPTVGVASPRPAVPLLYRGAILSASRPAIPVTRPVAAVTRPSSLPVRLFGLGAARPLAARPLAARPLAARPLAARPLAARPLAPRPLSAPPLAARPFAVRPLAARPLSPGRPTSLAVARPAARPSAAAAPGSLIKNLLSR